MTDCPNGDIRDLLPDLVNDRLAPETRAGVEAHVASCEDCREELALLRDVRRSMHRVPAVAVSDIVRALPAYRAPVRRLGNGWRIAAAALLIVGGGTSIVVARDQGILGGDSANVVVAPVVQVTPATPAVTHVAASDEQAASPSRSAAPATPTPAPRELAVASTSVGDLSEAELDALVNDLGSLDAVTPADVDQGAPVSPLPPSVTSGTGA